MEPDQEGFVYPVVDGDHCTQCGVCVSICPEIHKPRNSGARTASPKVLAAWHVDPAFRKASASGGVFAALAQRFWQDSGDVVGALYLEDHTVVHQLSSHPRDLAQLRGSKYLQSYMGYVYNDIRKRLAGGHKVLMCGTPCQIAGLYAVLGGDHEHLLTCDLICLGVNSPKVFQKYLKSLERQYKSKVTEINFRDKTLGWGHSCTRIVFENGEVYLSDINHDPFMQGYLVHKAYMRSCCHSCSFRGLPRYGDLTLADFWGIEKARPDLNHDLGTSLVLVNSVKGNSILGHSADLLVSQECDLSDTKDGNPSLLSSSAIGPLRDSFFASLDKLPFDKLCRKCLGIGISRNKFSIRAVISKSIRSLARFARERFRIVFGRFWVDLHSSRDGLSKRSKS